MSAVTRSLVDVSAIVGALPADQAEPRERLASVTTLRTSTSASNDQPKRPTPDEVAALEVERQAVHNRLKNTDSAQKPSAGWRTGLISRPIPHNIGSKKLARYRVAIDWLNEYLGKSRPTAMTPVKAGPIWPTEAEIAEVESQRVRLMELVTSMQRVQFKLTHPGEAWMVFAIDTPLRPDTGPNRLKDMRTAIERVQWFVDDFVTSVDEDEMTEAETAVDEEPVEVSQEALIDALGWRQIAVWEEFAKWQEYPFPVLLRELPTADLSTEELQRYALLLEVAELIIRISQLPEDIDRMPLQAMPTEDAYMVLSDLSWLFRLHDDLPRLERELAVVRLGVELLEGSLA